MILHGFRHISMEHPHLRMMFIDFPPQKKALFLVDFSLQRLITKESIKGDGIYRHAHYLISWAVELVQCVSCLHMFCPLNPDLLQKKQGDMFFCRIFFCSFLLSFLYVFQFLLPVHLLKKVQWRTVHGKHPHRRGWNSNAAMGMTIKTGRHDEALKVKQMRLINETFVQQQLHHKQTLLSRWNPVPWF